MTHLGRSLVLTGELTGDEDVAIDGQLVGHVSIRGKLTIGEHARIEADVRGARVEVRGKVTGSITATERIELHASAEVDGNLSANQVVIADGARYGGSIDMGKRTIRAKVAQFRADQAGVR